MREDPGGLRAYTALRINFLDATAGDGVPSKVGQTILDDSVVLCLLEEDILGS